MEHQIRMETKMDLDVDVDDEEQALYFPKKRKSAANIILDDDDEDDDDNYDYNNDDEDDEDDDVDFDWSKIPSSIEGELLMLKEKLLSPPSEECSLTDEQEIESILKDKTLSEVEKRKQIEILRRLQADYNKYCKNVPPLYNDDVGQLDISGAVLVRVNGRRLKKYSKSDYNFLVDFMYSCHQKRNLEEEELELRDLMKKHVRWGGGFVYYLTFSAVNKKTGVIRTYQAAITEDDDDEPLLGLFRDLTTSKTLAILSISGAEEDYAAKVEIFCNGSAKQI